VSISIINWALPILAFAVACVLLAPRIRNAAFWRATVTPLASIIGSGFLVVAPLLGSLVGTAATWAILGIVIAAYAIGAVVRFNIRFAEPLIETDNHNLLHMTERLSNVVLTVAYVISVAFYIRLLSAFVLRAFGLLSELSANLLTTGILLFIGLIGWYRGLRGLEQLEEWAVTIKLAIITALLVGLAHYDVIHGFGSGSLLTESRSVFEQLRMLGGMLLVIQGFETSRYLGNEYSANTRIQSMRLAQLLSAVIYVGFVWLVTPLLYLIPPGNMGETAIIDLVGTVALVLPMMLVIAAAMSQFSAAVADTLGAGGLVVEETDQRVSPRASYLILVGLAIALVWVANVFEIITLASRAFALYYLAQVFVAMQTAQGIGTTVQYLYRQAGFGLIGAVLLWIVIFAIPVQ